MTPAVFSDVIFCNTQSSNENNEPGKLCNYCLWLGSSFEVCIANFD